MATTPEAKHGTVPQRPSADPRARRRRARAGAAVAVLLGVTARLAGATCSVPCNNDPSPATTCQVPSNVTYTIDNGCTLTFTSGKEVVVPRDTTFTTASGNAYTISATALTVKGTLQAYHGTLTINTTGAVKTDGLSNAPGKLDVRNGGTLVVAAGGSVLLTGTDVNADGGTAGDGGSISITGTTVSGSTPIHADGNDGAGGFIEIRASGTVNLDGTVTANGVSSNSTAPGGTIFVDGGGTLDLTHNVQAKGAHNGDGGSITLLAVGAATLTGGVSASGVGGGTGANGGGVHVQASSLTITGGWTAVANASAVGGSVVIEATDGTLNLYSTASIDVSGGSGGHGGYVDLTAAGDLDVLGNVTANASGSGSIGGDIVLRAGGDATVSNTLEARSTASNGSNGAIGIIRACSVTISGTLRTSNPSGHGRNTISFVENANVNGSTIAADSDDSEANTFLCGCADSNGDGACDSAQCAGTVTTSGASISPARVTIPFVMPACD